MNEDKSNELVGKLISGEINRGELDLLLDSLEDPKAAVHIENSMKRYYLTLFPEGQKRNKAKKNK